MELPEQAQHAYTAWKQAKDAVKIAREAIKQAQTYDRTLMDAEDAKKLAHEAWKAERFQWDGKHEHLLTALAEARQAEKEAHLLFTDCYTTAIARQLAFDLFDDGRKVEVTVATKAKVVQEKPAPKPTNPHDDGDDA